MKTNTIFISPVSHPELLDAVEVARLYGARWDVEILFKEVKNKYALDVAPTANPQVIEAFIWIAVLNLLISRRIYTIIRRLNPDAKMVRFTHLRRSTIFSEKSSYQLMAILRFLGIEHSFDTSLKVYSSYTPAPHVNRKRLTEDWWALPMTHVINPGAEPTNNRAERALLLQMLTTNLTS